jgi:hypothetical protein
MVGRHPSAAVLIAAVAATGLLAVPAVSAQVAPSLQMTVTIDGRLNAADPQLDAGTTVAVEYLITNSGGEAVWSAYLWDDELGQVDCAPRHLMPGDAAICRGTIDIEPGLHRWDAYVWAWTTAGDEVEARAQIGYVGGGAAAAPGITLAVMFAGNSTDDPGPEVPAGTSAELTYRIENTGGVRLWSPFIWDDEAGSVDCDARRLDPGEVATCTDTLTAAPGDHRHRVYVWAWADDGAEASAVHDVFYRGGAEVTALEIEPQVGGTPAGSAPGPRFLAEGQLVWEFVATNAGTVDLWALYVEDEDLGRASCPKRHLEPGESVVCPMTVFGSAGSHDGRVGAKAWDDYGERAEDESDRHAFGYLAGAHVDIETYVDGFDGDTAAGPRRPVGETLTFTYEITNTGDADLDGVSVHDDRWGAIACPTDRLDAGASMTCEITRVMEWGNYSTNGRVSAVSGAQEVTDVDPTWWHVRYAERISIIDIEVSVEGIDADAPPGPNIMTGEPVEFVYEVANLGNSALWSYYIHDPRVPSGEIECEGWDNLFEGDAVTCRAFGTAGLGRYSSVVEVVAWDNDGARITDEDPVHYNGMP